MTKLITIYDWAKEKGVKPALAYNWAKRGLIPVRKSTRTIFLILKDTPPYESNFKNWKVSKPRGRRLRRKVSK